MNPVSSGDADQLERLQKTLLPIFADAVVGEFGRDVALPDDESAEFIQLLVGVQVMLEVIRQQQRELDEAQSMVVDVQYRTSEILARVVDRGQLPEDYGR